MNAPYGRRGLPPAEEDPDAAEVRPRRGVTAPEPDDFTEPAEARPRRGLIDDTTEPEGGTRPAWFLVAGLGVVMAVAVAALWLLFGSRDGGPTALPASPSPTATTSNPTAEPSPSATGTSPQTPSSEPAQAPMMGPTGTPTPQSGTPEPTDPATTEPQATVVTLDDGAAFTMPDEWELYADEQVQNDRRLVRIREVGTDVRIQAVSLTTVNGPLEDACLDLISDHRQLYTNVAEGLPVSVPISGEGEGVSCNFTGTRTSDGVASGVEFTLLQRGTTTLVFRDTIPTAVPADAPARAQLVAMECEAAQGFGVLVDQCSLTPARGDG